MLWIYLQSSEMCNKALNHFTKLWIISQTSKLLQIDWNSFTKNILTKIKSYKKFYNTSCSSSEPSSKSISVEDLIAKAYFKASLPYLNFDQQNITLYYVPKVEEKLTVLDVCDHQYSSLLIVDENIGLVLLHWCSPKLLFHKKDVTCTMQCIVDITP